MSKNDWVLANVILLSAACGGRTELRGTNLNLSGGTSAALAGAAATGGLKLTSGGNAGFGGSSLPLATGGTKTGIGGVVFVPTGGTRARTGGSGAFFTGGTRTATGGTNTVSTGGTRAGGNTGVSTGGTRVTTGGSGGISTGGGTQGGTAGAATGGSITVGGSNCTRGSNVLSDFETGKGTLYPVPSVPITGYWYVYRDSQVCSASSQFPASVFGAAVDASALPTTDPRYGTCNKYAMHSSIVGCRTYSGFGAILRPQNDGLTGNGPVDLSAYDGISFWIKAGATANIGPIFLELQSQECVPPPPDGSGTAKNSVTDRYNCHGRLIANLSTDWQQVFVPFGTTGPRWIPSPYPVPNLETCTSNDFCEAPALNLQNVLALQFSLEDPWARWTSVISNYDVWLDDVTLYKFSDTPANRGLATWAQSGAYGYPQNKYYPGCEHPARADGKFVQDAFVDWKKKFIAADGSNLRVICIEIDQGATLSEGIAYGMLIAVYMGDRALFDGLLGYWKAHPISAIQNMLMTWKIGGQPASGSAADADEDAAFALQMAVKQWGSVYQADATAILAQFLANDVDANGYLKAGSAVGGQDESNPSYFAPAYYKYFATVDVPNANKWNLLVSHGYEQLVNISGTNGLVPSWCSANCTKRGPGKGPDDAMYQYDAHRMPWRIGLDQCWNKDENARAYLNKVVSFFSNVSSTGGLSSLGDVYTEAGTLKPDSLYNSMSLIGCLGVGAMGSTAAGAASLRDRTWQYLLEGQYTANPGFKVGRAYAPMYDYRNATVGLLAMLALSGNFYIM